MWFFFVCFLTVSLWLQYFQQHVKVRQLKLTSKPEVFAISSVTPIYHWPVDRCRFAVVHELNLFGQQCYLVWRLDLKELTGNRPAGESKQPPSDMEKVNEEEDNVSPQEYVALSNFTGDGSDQVREKHRRTIAPFSPKSSGDHLSLYRSCLAAQFQQRGQTARAHQAFPTVVVGRAAWGHRLCPCQLPTPGCCWGRGGPMARWRVLWQLWHTG